MKQGLLAFQYEEEKSTTGMTALSGLMTYVELMHVAGLRSSVERRVGLRGGGQGWTDSQIITSLILLNLAGGESVMDLEVLEKDAGLCRVLRHAETHGMRRRERRALKARWRGERWRSVPSDSVVFRYLERFHDAGEEAKREAHRAFIPSPNDALKGLGKVNAGLMDFVQSRSPHTQATLDMDACLVESHKKEALYSYKKYRAYQPLTTYWAEADLVVHSEFRDGNVPAGHQQLRVLKEALGHLPVGVAKVMLRSDTAGYQQELLRYCAEGRDERFGVIEFAVGVDVTAEFRRAVSEVAEEDWHVLHKPGSNRVETGQEWAEVNFVPNWIGHSKNSPEYRFMATRERLIEQPLPAMEGQMKMPFPAMELSNRGWFKVFGVVMNRTLAGDEVIWWSRQRCGKGEEVHSVLKSDLAGGRLPSRLFGANAAWWAIAVLAFNLSSAMKRLVLGGQWVSRRLKAVRFALIALPGRVMRHARRLIIRLSRDHPSYELLLSPNPPKDTDGRREDSGRGWVRELQGRWPGVGVDGRPADGLQSPHRAPKALCGSCDARDGERIRSRGLSRPGWREIAGTLSQLQAGRQAGNGMACSRAKARLN